MKTFIPILLFSAFEIGSNLQRHLLSFSGISAQPEPTPEPEPFAGILPEAPFLPDSLPRASSLRHQPPAGTHSGSEPDTGLLPQSEPQPEPEPEPNPSTGQNNPAFSEPSVPLPEPAIKFDNIEVEDYGEVTEAVVSSMRHFIHSCH